MERYNGPDAATLDHATRESVADETQSYGVADRFGREIGAHATVNAYATRPPVRYSEHSGEIGYLAPGRYFLATVQSTRNGAHYGASQSGEIFATLAEALAYVARRFEASRKAAARKAGK